MNNDYDDGVTWSPDLNAARQALQDFLPAAGRDYAAGRNHDPGPGKRGAVSKLSPWIRLRLLPESEVVQQTLSRQSATAAEKFIQEVCWRTYWKGWLHLRPGIWDDYLAERMQLLEEHKQNDRYQSAITGQTGIACFDAWAQELITTGYLHNHARMWFASIWIHTLQLPWQLGADFFLRHLLDGDAASNTLGWRWVAGLQTLGKTYLATAENIQKYTGGRFYPQGQLATEPHLPDILPQHPTPRELRPLAVPDLETARIGLIIGDDDLMSYSWISKQVEIAAVAGILPDTTYHELQTAQPVIRFRTAAMENLLRSRPLPTECITEGGNLVTSLPQWIVCNKLEAVCMAEPAIGIWNNLGEKIAAILQDHSIPLYLLRRSWDEALYPHATRGFFKFKQQIPTVIDQLESLD